MGQFFNQPDFATSAETVVIGTTNVKNSALYIGTGGNIEVTAVGSSSAVVFKNIPDGSFLPVIVSSITAGANTTVSDVIAIK
tara:strand:+ start:2381 stop:2626 length:246 start_codon:yes stop_codon:yes gene_type:complete